MSELLDDPLNLEIVKNLCSGVGVSVNVSALARELDKHRNTIKAQVDILLENHIITHPYYPYLELLKDMPILAMVKADLPKNDKIEEFLVTDERVFAAFWSWDEEYNTLMFEFHKNLDEYYEWKEKIVEDGRIPRVEGRAPAEAMFFSNSLLVKYLPSSSIICWEKKFQHDRGIQVGDIKISSLGFKILRKLMQGECVRTNENELSQKLDVHRRTVVKRIQDLQKEGVIGTPACRFPRFITPPGYVLVVTLLRVNKGKEHVFQYLKNDCRIPIVYETHTGKYNVLLFGTFPDVEHQFKWEKLIHKRFPETFTAVKKIYLAPEMIASINPQKVSLGMIEERKRKIIEQKRLVNNQK